MRRPEGKAADTGSGSSGLGGFAAAIVTVSDSVSRGENTDESGPAAAQLISERGAELLDRTVVPDEEEAIAGELRRLAAKGAALILTAGGTGVAPRDVTPEATTRVCDRMVPGLAELMRSVSLQKTPYAAISRAAAGITGQTLIVNLPGNPRAVVECLEAIIGVLPHALALIAGRPTDHRP